MEFAISNLYKLLFDVQNFMSGDEIRKILLLLHIGLIILLRGHKAGRFLRGAEFLLNQQ